MVKVYERSSCPWCVKAKNYLKSINVYLKNLMYKDDMEAREEMVGESNKWEFLF